jgi:uncharacterized membrane protein YfcA
MTFRTALLLTACLVLGAALGFALLESGILAFIVLPGALLVLGISLLQSDRRTRKVPVVPQAPPPAVSIVLSR